MECGFVTGAFITGLFSVIVVFLKDHLKKLSDQHNEKNKKHCCPNQTEEEEH